MKIAVESKIPFIRGVFEAAGHTVAYLDPGEFTPASVRDMDALVIRTRTRCDASLLEGSAVSVIATATIGTDHIDLPYCASQGIRVHNAPGCNAPAVAQYVLSSIAALGRTDGVLGIVGVGHVGGILARWAEANGIRTLLCDPPLGLPVPLERIAVEADVISFHTPLDASTRHMADARFFDSTLRKPVIINAARGAVVDTPDLIEALKSGRIGGAVVDCWENEPNISRELLALADIATPHIAGYSLEGKRRATAMAVRAIDPTIALPVPPVSERPTLAEIRATYNPMADTEALRPAPDSFEALRNGYDYRPEP